MVEDSEVAGEAATAAVKEGDLEVAKAGTTEVAMEEVTAVGSAVG